MSSGATTGAMGTWGIASTVGGERPGWPSASLSTHKPKWGPWKVAWITKVSGKMGTLTRPPHGLVAVPSEAAGPQAARPALGLTDGRQGAAVPAVEVGPGFGLTALAAGQDPVAAAAGQQAHPDGAATLVAELEEGNPARGHTVVAGACPLCHRPSSGTFPISSARGQSPGVLSLKSCPGVSSTSRSEQKTSTMPRRHLRAQAGLGRRLWDPHVPQCGAGRICVLWEEQL